MVVLEAALLEDPKHRAEIIAGLAKGFVPLKYAYCGSAAHTHDRLARTPGYNEVVSSVPAEVEVVTAGVPPESSIQMAEVGPGNGEHTGELIAQLASADRRCDSYLGLDFSVTLRKMASAHLRDRFPGMPTIETAAWDAESGPTRAIETWRRRNGPVLACLLGQTLGNVHDKQALLTNIWHSLRPDDYLLIGLSARSAAGDDDLYAVPYRTEIFERAALEPFRAVGIDLDQVAFRVDYQDGEVIGEATPNVDIRVDDTLIPAGRPIRCFQSRRFQLAEVAALMANSGWSIIQQSKKGKGEHLVILARAREARE